MKPSSSTQGRPRSIKVRTLNGSKDVWGARHEPKGWLAGPEHPGSWLSLIARRWLNPRNVDLSCTKGDLRLPWCRYVWICVRNTAQLVAIDSNRRLSRIVRNLTELPSIVVINGKWNGSKNEILNGYGYYCAVINNILHVCHRLVTNLEMNSYN